VVSAVTTVADVGAEIEVATNSAEIVRVAIPKHAVMSRHVAMIHLVETSPSPMTVTVGTTKKI
jgi:hypothetical protein